MWPFRIREMKGLGKYDINIQGLENKNYQYDFSGDDTFFSEFEQDIIEGGSFKTEVLLEKSSSFIRLTFNIHSDLKLICDRTLEQFNEQFQSVEKHIYKFGDEDKEISEDLDMISHGSQKINIAKLIFDYILLQVPIKKLHPSLRGDEGEEGKMVYTDPQSDTKQEENISDPRWSALINLKNKNLN